MPKGSILPEKPYYMKGNNRKIRFSVKSSAIWGGRVRAHPKSRVPFVKKLEAND
jgi:hypothetical protein